MTPLAARFPDAIIGLLPDLFQVKNEIPKQFQLELRMLRPEICLREVERTYDFSVDIKLQLFRGLIADPYRFGALITGKPGYGSFH